MHKTYRIVVCVIVAIAFMFIATYVYDQMNHYSVPATVYGTDYDGYTLFETPDGNIWAYKLADHLPIGKQVRLNMYDRSPDGRTVVNNVILSVNIDGVDVTETETVTE